MEISICVRAAVFPDVKIIRKIALEELARLF